jgi:hypothetical protein
MKISLGKTSLGLVPLLELKRPFTHRKQNPIHVISDERCDDGQNQRHPLFVRKNPDEQSDDAKSKRKNGAKIKD